jgi:hypothetical protein
VSGRRWTADELEYLEGAYGDVRVERIARRVRRTVSAVHNQAVKMRLGRNRPSDVMALSDVMKNVLGMDSWSVLKRWVDRGLLPATKSETYGVKREWWVRDADLEAFLRANPHLVDRDKVQPPWRAFVPERWITLIEAFRRGAAWPLFLESAVKAGLLPEARKRGEFGVWVIPESLLPALVAARRRMTTDPDHRRLVLAYNRNEARSQIVHKRTYLNRRARELADGTAA